MQQTLGKRIMEHRKRLGLTQDALAEKLGITAQAISKWENDLSCPDIAMLPRLAEIFGISTDQLLGMETKEKVHEAEVIDGRDDGDDDGGIFKFSIDAKEENNGKWEFRWDSGRRNAVGFACWVLLMGILLLCKSLYSWEVGFWSLAWPSFLLMLGLFGGKKFSLSGLGFILLGGYFLVENLGFMPAELSGKILWPGLVILFGLSLLFDALRKPKKSNFSVVRKGGNGEKTKWTCHNSDSNFLCDLSFGEHTHLVEASMLTEGDANCSFGSLVVDLRGCDAVSENCHIDANCSFGTLTLLVPRRFAIVAAHSTSFASVHFNGHPDNNPEGMIHLDADVSFGEIRVEYI